MKVLLINNHTRRIDQTKKLLEDFEVKIVDVKDINIDLNGFDFIVLSGGKIATAFSQKKIIKNEIDLIKNTNLPIFGICLGMQFIVRAFSPVNYKRLYPRRREVMELKYIGQTLKVFNSHNWSVPTVKPPLISFSKSTDGVEIIKHESKPIWGVQFHPEVDEEFGTNGNLIFDEFLTKIQPQ